MNAVARTIGSNVDVCRRSTTSRITTMTLLHLPTSSSSSFFPRGTSPRRNCSHLQQQTNEEFSSTSSNPEPVQNNNLFKTPSRKKEHTMTVCMVPDPKHVNVWTALTKARTELRDPGLFRWPPHANILYPFFEIQSKTDDDTMSIDEDTISLLSDAVKQCEPFRVSLCDFGTFGGNKRGVLYLYPSSFRFTADKKSCKVDDGCDASTEEPLIELQSVLQAAIPECHDQKKNGKYTPHITLSHFKTLNDALEGQRKIEIWWEPLEFDVREIYLLKRIGDDGQFKILAALPLGQNSAEPQVFPQLLPFPSMPMVEEDWVRQERMALKARRNGNGGNGNRKNTKDSTHRKRGAGNINRGPSRSRDSPEEIAKKRAERALKRERLAQEAAEIEAAIQLNDSNN